MIKKRRYNRRVEDCHQISYFDWLKKFYPFVFEVTAAIFNQGQRNQLYAYAMGLKPGLPDIMMFVPSMVEGVHYNGLLIELKRPADKITTAGKLSEKQKAMIPKLQDNGYYVAVCFGWFEAKKVTELYLGD
jgi:hypothetical protein